MNHSNYVLNRFKICKIKKRKRRIFSILLIVILAISLIITYCIKIINPIIYEYTSAEIERLLVKSTNKAIDFIFSKYNYEDLISINYDKEGNISFIKANQIEINKIINSVSIQTQNIIDSSAKVGIFIPIGTCSGIGFLSGKGNNINISIDPIGNVISYLKSEFTQAGINQTLHKIYINVQSEMSIVLPFTFKKVTKNIEILISECLIVGKIPNVYFKTDNLKDFY